MGDSRKSEHGRGRCNNNYMEITKFILFVIVIAYGNCLIWFVIIISRALSLFILYPFIRVLGHVVGTKIMVMVCFFAIVEQSFRAGTYLYPVILYHSRSPNIGIFPFELLNAIIFLDDDTVIFPNSCVMRFQ